MEGKLFNMTYLGLVPRSFGAVRKIFLIHTISQLTVNHKNCNTYHCKFTFPFFEFRKEMIFFFQFKLCF